MSVEITDIDIRREDFRPSATGSDYLLANLGTKFTAYVDLKVHTFVIPTAAQAFTMGDQSFPTDDFITDDLGAGRFAEFHVGDTIEISGSSVDSGNFNQGYTIIAKPDNNTIQVNVDLSTIATSVPQTLEDGIIRVTAKPTGFRYFFGLIENSEAINFNSKIDGQEQQYKYGHATQIPATFQVMTPLFKKSWQYGQCSVKRVNENTTDHIYTFQVKHEFIVSPFYLDNQRNAILNGNPPPYFSASKCLKYAIRAQAHYDVDDPNVFLPVEDSRNGNTGWLDENFNGGQTNYSIANVAYERVSDSLAIAGIEEVAGGTDQTKVTFEIHNATDTPFRTSGNATKVNCSIFIFPEDPAQYQNVNTLMKENYCFDKAVATAAGSPTGVNGDNFGGNFQIIEGLTATFVSSSQIDVEFTANLGSSVISHLATLTDKNFLIIAETEDLDLGNEASDAVALNVDISNFVETVGNKITYANSFIEHPSNSVADASSPGTMRARSNDEIAANTEILLDTASHSPIIDRISAYLIAKKTDGTEAILEQRDFNVSGVQLVGGIQNPNIQIPVPFHILSSEIRGEYELVRDSTLDSGDDKGFRLTYPFIFRWEEWEQLILAGALPGDFFDNSQDFQGYNHNWDRLGDFTDWGIYYRVETELTANGETQTESEDFEIIHRTFDENPDWDCEIRPYDQAGNLLQAGSDFYIKGSIDTEIRATFTKVAGSIPALSNVSMVFRILVFENGNYIDSYTLSSVYDRENLGANWWQSILSTGLIEITKSGNDYIGKADLSQLNLPTNNAKYTVIARIYVDQPVLMCSFTDQFGVKLFTISSVDGETDRVSDAEFSGIALSSLLFFLDGIEMTSVDGTQISGSNFIFPNPIHPNDYSGNYDINMVSMCANNAITGIVQNATGFANADLNGLSTENCLVFVAGLEMTTKPDFQIAGNTASAPWKMNGPYKFLEITTLHYYNTVSGETVISVPALAGKDQREFLVFADGVYMNIGKMGWSSGTGQITFPNPVHGLVKVVEL